MTEPGSATTKDLTRGRLSQALLWGFPIAAMLSADFVDLHAVLWPSALLVMGVACVANAFRCRRMHCYFTGPWFLALAALSLVYGLGVIPLGDEGWRWIGIATLVGAVVFYYVPERLWGRYAGNA